jgi:hypothetical protein
MDSVFVPCVDICASLRRASRNQQWQQLTN